MWRRPGTSAVSRGAAQCWVAANLMMELASTSRPASIAFVLLTLEDDDRRGASPVAFHHGRAGAAASASTVIVAVNAQLLRRAQL